MFETISLLAITGAAGLLLGVAYPLAALAFYPVYRYLGGRHSLKRYMSRI